MPKYLLWSFKKTLILLLLCSIHKCGFGIDSTYTVSAIAGTYGYVFNNMVLSSSPHTGFMNYEFSPTEYYCLGLKTNKQLTERKELSASLIYSNAHIVYLYTSPKPPWEETGKLDLDGLVANTIVQYRVFKWLKINYGFSHYFNLVNSFDKPDIAKNISWYDANGKSNMRPYTFALCYGAEVKLYKKLSIELNFMRGLNSFIRLQIVDDPRSATSLKFRYLGLTLNYRFIH